MPTDLTGAPTSLGIGTYNVDADAPSGLGFNAAMAQIDALIAARVSKPAGAVSGDVPVWNGTTWVRPTGTPSATTFLRGDGTWSSAGVKTTTSAISGGPPASPSDGDIWIATGVDANGTRWAFQYNAGSASAYKWEFIGGSDLFSIVETRELTSAAAYVDLTTVGPSATVPRAGDYIIQFGATGDTDSSSTNPGGEVGLNIGGSIVVIARVAWGSAAQFDAASVSRKYRGTGLAASAAIKLQYGTSNTVQIGFAARFLALLPVRIS